MFRLSTEDLKTGGQLIIFPEGDAHARRAGQRVQGRLRGDGAGRRRADPDRHHRDGHAVPVEGLVGDEEAARDCRCAIACGSASASTSRPTRTSNAFVGELRDYFVDELADARARRPVERRAVRRREADDAAIAGRRHPCAASPADDLPSLSSSRWGCRSTAIARRSCASRTHVVLIPSYNAGPKPRRDGARRAGALVAGLGRDRRQRRRQRARRSRTSRAAMPASAC